MADITVKELKEKLDNQEEFIFIDVREPYEYEEFNLGARLIPLGSFMKHLGELDQHREEEIVLMCRSGARSGAATETLAQLGYKNPRNLIGGIMKWKEEYGIIA